MELNAPARVQAFPEQFMYKSRLQEYAQKSAIPSPEYRIVNEGHPHAPQFRSSVLVDGKTFTSHGTFVHRKAAEHDVAKLALESLSREIESEAVPLIQQETKLGEWIFRSKSRQNSCSNVGACKGYMFAMEVNVNEELDCWPEQSSHMRKWVSVTDGYSLCRYPWMCEALDAFVKLLSKSLELPRDKVSKILSYQEPSSCFVERERTIEDATFCKSILLEYAVKMKMEKPTYTTSQAEGVLPVFISFSTFNGQTYTGDPAMNKKEAEQRAARVVIESILADSNTRRLMCEIVRSKKKLYATFCKKSCSSGLPPVRKFSSRSRTQNNPNDNVNGEELLASLTNNQVPANIRSGDDQIAKAAARETFIPEGGSLAATTSSTSNSSDGVKLTEPSTRPEDSAGVVLTSGMKRSDAMKNGGTASKKTRTIEQTPAPSANPEISPEDA